MGIGDDLGGALDLDDDGFDFLADEEGDMGIFLDILNFSTGFGGEDDEILPVIDEIIDQGGFGIFAVGRKGGKGGEPMGADKIDG